MLVYRYVLLKERNMLLTLEHEANKFRYVMPAPDRMRKVSELEKSSMKHGLVQASQQHMVPQDLTLEQSWCSLCIVTEFKLLRSFTEGHY